VFLVYGVIVEFSIVELKDTLRKKIIFFVLLAVTAIAIIVFDDKQVYAVTFIINILIILYSSKYFMMKKKGSISFSDNMITILPIDEDKIVVTVEEITSLRVEMLKSFRGLHSYFHNDVIKMIFTVRSGDILCNVLLNGSKEKNKFIGILKNLYRNKIVIKEYDYNGGRSFLLNSKLNYNDIQKIKKEYSPAGNIW
jgi:hypothetical protein